MIKRLLFALLLLPLTAFGALTVTNRGTVSPAASSEASTTFSPTSTIAAGSTGVLIVGADSGAGAGNTNFPAAGTSLIDSVGNIWRIRIDRASSANIGAGTETVIATCPKLITAMTSSDSLTITYTTNSISAKCYQFYQVSGAANNIAVSVISAGASSSTSTPTITTGNSVNVGDLMIAADAVENGGLSITADSDTLNGSWSTQLNASVGSGTTGVSLVSQYKIQTTTNSAQVYDLSYTGAQDQTMVWLVLTEVNDKCRRVYANAASGTSTALQVGTPLEKDSFGVLVMALDDTGSTGTVINVNPAVAGTPPGGGTGSTMTDSAGNVWTLRMEGVYGPAGVSTGSEIAIFTAPITASSGLQPTDTITITYGNAVTAKFAAVWEFPASTYITGVSGSGAATGTPTVTTVSIQAGDIVVAVGGAEGTNTWVDATDANNGTWMKGAAQSQSTGLAAMSGISQYKITTGTATQLFNPTLTSADVILGYIQIRLQPAASFFLFDYP